MRDLVHQMAAVVSPPIALLNNVPPILALAFVAAVSSSLRKCLRRVLSSMPFLTTRQIDSWGMPTALICSTSLRSSSVGSNDGFVLRGIFLYSGEILSTTL